MYIENEDESNFIGLNLNIKKLSKLGNTHGENVK